MSDDTPVLLPLSAITLVFGLEWFPLLGGQLRRQSLRLARKHGASYLVLSSEQAGSVGMARLRKLHLGRKQPLHSAAQRLACLFPQGTVALILPLQGNSWWLVAVHDGAVVVRTDRLYIALDQAQAALSDVRLAYPQMRDLTQEAGVAPSLNDLQSNCTAASLLQKAHRWHRVLPMPVQWFATALIVVFVAPMLWTWSQSTNVPVPSQAQPDAQLAWNQAVRYAMHTRCLHGAHGTRPVLNSLYELPVVINGWHLVQVECSAGRSAWMCQGDYQRRNQTASNDGFLRHAPSFWSSRFPTMDQAVVAWTVAATCSLFTTQDLETTTHNERYLFSAWQSIRPAFSRLEAGPPQAFSVIPPQDSKGQPLPKPDGLVKPVYRDVHVHAPLRSVELLLPHIARIEWQRLLLSLNEAVKPTLKHSQLNVTFQGVLHEVAPLSIRQDLTDDNASESSESPY